MLNVFIFQGGQSGHRTLLYGHAILLRHLQSNMVSCVCRLLYINSFKGTQKERKTFAFTNLEFCCDVTISSSAVPLLPLHLLLLGQAGV